MCVIAIKQAGIAIPSEDTLETMWYNNPDGAGYMYADGQKVHIRKGFMQLRDLQNSLRDLSSRLDLAAMPMVFHFRIGTHGGNIAANTHPFPITDSIPALQQLRCCTSLGVAHNGIIPVTPRSKDISDTMEYIAAQLAPLHRYAHDFYRSKDLLQMIGNATGSKLAFMNGQGEIFTVGNFITDQTTGMLYSNSSYSWRLYYRKPLCSSYAAASKTSSGTGMMPYTYPSYGGVTSWEWGDGYLTDFSYAEDLMMVPSGAYIVDRDTGAYYEADDWFFLIDDLGSVYVLDDVDGNAYELSNTLSVYNKEGFTVRFDPKKTEPYFVMPKQLNIEDLQKNDPHDLIVRDKDDAEADLDEAKNRKDRLRNLGEYEAGHDLPY